jgi:TolA-binding protein
MLGGAVMAGRHSQQAQYREQDQEARIEDLESQQQQPAAGAAPAAPAAAPPAAAQSPLVDQIKQLADLKEAGVLTPEEFDAAKQKLLAS